jgi:hypothetical protein
MEIKATDLRIGNWVQQSPINMPFKVTANFIADMQNSKIGIVGIPLTEELLLKMGFVYHDYVWYHKDIAIVTIVGVDGCLVVHGHSQPLIHIRFLHQLQNNFYFNTDLELTLS